MRRGLARIYALIGALREVEHVLAHGDHKYSPGDWADEPRDVYKDIEHALAHIKLHKEGEFRERESGLLHLAHAVARLLIAMFHEGLRE